MTAGKFDSAPPEQSGKPAGSSPPAAGHGDAQAPPAELEAELDWSEPNSILFFGARTQRELARISDRLLQMAAAKGVGKAAADLDQMLAVIRRFQPEPAARQPWWRRLLGRSQADATVHQVANLLNRMDQTAAQLERRKTALLTESVTMQRLAERSEQHYRRLGQYETVARRSLARVPDGLRADLLARCEDLALSRQVAQQSLAALSVAQQATRDLLSRVNAVLDHTLVLWKQHMTQVIAIWRGRETAEAISELSGTSAELASMRSELADARAQLALQLKQGKVDLEAVAVANRRLVQELELGADAASRAREAASEAARLLVHDS